MKCILSKVACPKIWNNCDYLRNNNTYFKIKGVFVLYLLAICLWKIKNIRPLLLCLLFDVKNVICKLQGCVSFDALLGFELSGVAYVQRVSANRSMGQVWCLSSGISYFLCGCF